MNFKNIIYQYSENLGGFVSLLGSVILIFLGDIKSILAAIIFTIAELSLVKFGHKVEGYTTAAFLFVAGNLCLIFSSSLTDSNGVIMALCGMSFAWLIGASKYFLGKFAAFYNNNRLTFYADCMPAIAGSLNIIFKFPAILSAIFYEHYIVSFAIFCWMLSDVLAGRLQEKFRLFLRFLKRSN